MFKSVMVAGLSADRQYLTSTLSFTKIKTRPADGVFVQHGTRGDVGRGIIADQFLKSNHDGLLMLDLDQRFPENTLEQLRSHARPMVSGHYMKRTTRFLQSIWQYTLDGDWPYLPYIAPNIPITGLHRIATTGMGCVLIHREVVERVRAHIPEGSNPFDIGTVPELTPFAGLSFGSDYRFFYYAQKLGFELWGDADLECPHVTSLWLTRTSHEDIQPSPEKTYDHLMKRVFEASIRSRGMITLNAVVARKAVLEGEYAGADGNQKLIIAGQIAECETWEKELIANSPPQDFVRAWADKKPEDKPQFPSFRTEIEKNYAIEHREEAINGADPEAAAAFRRDSRQNEATDAAKRLHLFNLNTSTNQGEMTKVK